MHKWLYSSKSIWQKLIVCSVVSKNLLFGVACFYSVRLLAAKRIMYFYIFYETNENEVTVVKLTVLTVRMALRSLKAAGFSIQVETINIL